MNPSHGKGKQRATDLEAAMDTHNNLEEETTPAPSTPDVSPLGKFKLYRPPSSSPSSTTISSDVLPDSFFSPTATEIKAAQATLSARSSSMNNAPLMVRDHREAQKSVGLKAKYERWPQTTIRAKFPDRTQLEKVFNSTDKIKSVYAFVREALREDVKPIKFILYQTPPMREFKVSDPAVRNLTLMELQFVPSCVVLVKFVDDSLNGTNVPAPLADSVLEQAQELPAPPASEEPGRILSSSSSSAEGSLSAGSIEKKVPKWFKIGSKK